MIKIFKSGNELMKELGFNKSYCSNKVLIYERYNTEFNYVHQIEFHHNKKLNQFILISSQEGLNKEGFNHAVGLSEDEFKACRKLLKDFKKGKIKFKEALKNDC